MWVNARVNITPFTKVSEFSFKITESEANKYRLKYAKVIKDLIKKDFELNDIHISDTQGYSESSELIKEVTIRTNIKIYENYCFTNISIRTNNGESALLSILFPIDNPLNYVMYVSTGSKWSYATLMAGILALKVALSNYAPLILSVLKRESKRDVVTWLLEGS